MIRRLIATLIFPLMIFAMAMMPRGLEAGASESDGDAPVLFDPFDRGNPLVKLPGIALTYTKGRDRSDAIFFDGSTYLREPSLTFVPAQKNWTEGTVAFWINPSKYPQAPQSWPILLFNWNDYPRPQAGYVGTIALTHDGRISDSGSWEWGGGNPVSLISKTVIPLNAWTHVAIAWSKMEGFTRIYVNNEADTEIDQYIARGSNGSIHPWLAGYGGFIGAIDDLKIYKASLSGPFYGGITSGNKGTPRPYTPRPDASRPAVLDVRTIPDFHAVPRENDLAVVIGIDNYKSLPRSDFSTSDAGLMLDYLKALGFQRRNIEFVTDGDATRSGIEKMIEAWLPNRVNADSTVIVYYSGHGAPEPKTGDAYLVPYDGDPNYLEVTGYSLKRLYEKLGQLQAAEVVVLLDSCFSGAGGRSVLAKGARPLVMTTRAAPATPNMVVLSATQGTQISTSSPEKGHGIFTYHFLNALKNGKKSIAEIYEHIKPSIEDEAKALNVQQSPSIHPAAGKLQGRFVLRK